MKKVKGFNFPHSDLSPALYAIKNSEFNPDDEKAPLIDTSMTDPACKDSMDPSVILKNMRLSRRRKGTEEKSEAWGRYLEGKGPRPGEEPEISLG